MSVKQFRCFLIIVLLKYCYGQHILDETCTFQVVLTNSTETLTFASQVHHISSRNKDVYINFCKPLRSSIPNCNPKSQVCIKSKRNGKNQLKTPVTSFQGVKDFNNVTQVDNIALITNDLGKCDDGEDEDKYEFRVVVDMKKIVLENKMESDECSVEITIPHPKILQRDCGFSYNGLIIDMQPTRQFPEVTSSVGNTQYIMAACKLAPSCGSAGICEITTDSRSVFSVAETQHINYDERNNQVTIRGRKSIDKTRSEVVVKCNWTENFGNLQKQLARFKYTVESKFGCVKMPLNCKISDMDNYEYDLSTLNNPSGWEVRNTTGKMLINICGSLKHAQVTQCSEIYSQVCLEQSRQYLSYGALHSGLHFDGEDIILTYTHGSTCKMQPSEYLSTRVTLQCHPDELGPVLTAIVNCTANIQWRTPKACAKSIEEESSFGFPRVMYDLKRTDDLSCSLLLNRQLFRLASLISDGMTFDSRIFPKVKYLINICRSIAITRDNYYCGVTGGCIDDGNETSVKKRFKNFGTLSNPKFENDELVIRYTGEYCQNSTRKEMVITFNCSQQQEPLKLSTETKCRVDFVWDTPLACKRKTQRSTNCNISSQDGVYLDLFNLPKRHFQVIHSNTTYNFDLCSDVVLTNSTQVVGMDMLRRLVRKNCQYSIIYDALNETKACDSTSLTTVNIDLLCHRIEHDDHFENESIKDCELNVALKCGYVCKLFDECTAKYEKEVAKIDISNDLSTLIVPTPKPVAVVVQKVCTHDESKIHVNLLQANGTKSNINYTIGGVGEDKHCSGFICRNNVTIATLEVCPSGKVEDNGVELNFFGPECSKGFYKVKVVLRCNAAKTTNNLKVLWDEECFAYLEVEERQSCLVLSRIIAGSTNTGYIIGIVLCLLIILTSTMIALRYKRNKCKYRYLDGINLCHRSPDGSTGDTLYERNVQD